MSALARDPTISADLFFDPTSILNDLFWDGLSEYANPCRAWVARTS